jgi:hypothetical protein
MKIKIVCDETNEHICDLDLTEEQVQEYIKYAENDLQNSNNSIKYNKESPNYIINLLQHSIIKILEGEIKKYTGDKNYGIKMD